MPLDTLPVDILSCIFNYCTPADRIALRCVSKLLRTAHIAIYPVAALDDMLSALSEIATSAEYAKDRHRSEPHYRPITKPDSDYNSKLAAQLDDVHHNSKNNGRSISKYIDRLITGLLYYKVYTENYRKIGRFGYIMYTGIYKPAMTNVAYVNYTLCNLLTAYIHELLTREMTPDNLYNITKYLAMYSQLNGYGYFMRNFSTYYEKKYVQIIVNCIPSDIQVISKMLIMGYSSAFAFVHSGYTHRGDAHYLQVKQDIVRSVLYLNPDVLCEFNITPVNIVSNICNYNNRQINVHTGTFAGARFNSEEINIMQNMVYNLTETDSEDVYNSIITQGVNIDKEIELWCAGNYEYPTDMWPGYINYI